MDGVEHDPPRKTWQAFAEAAARRGEDDRKCAAVRKPNLTGCRENYVAASRSASASLGLPPQNHHQHSTAQGKINWRCKLEYGSSQRLAA